LSASRGRDFWLGCPTFGNTGDSATVCQIFILTDGAATYSVSANSQYNFSASGVVTASTPATISIPRLPFPDLQLGGSNNTQTVENKGIHVTADADVTVYMYSPWVRPEIYLGIPTPSLGNDYFILSYENALSDPQYFAALATEDNTTVTLSRSCVAFGQPSLTSPLLNQGSVFEQGCPFNSLAGTHITSDHPVALMAETDIVSIGSGGACGQVLELMLPDTGPGWGTEFYSAPLPAGATDTYRVLASQNGTSVTVDRGGGNTQTFALNLGQNQDLSFKGAARFTSNNPISVAQYASATGCRGELSGGSEMQLLPITDFGQLFRFFAPPDDPVSIQHNFILYSHYAIIVAPNAGINAVQLNGATVSGFTPLPGGTFQYVVVPVAQGQNVVTSSQPIVVYSAGFQGNGAYLTMTSF
jgi:hypothetical protein